jgi:hypothetical protein
VVAVAEASRGNAGRRGKIRCHPQIVFLRENLVRRVARRSLQFSVPTSGRKRRAPTNEGCRRSYPVHPDAWPDNREFLEREKGVGSSASTHLGSVVRFSKRRACTFRCCSTNSNYYLFAATRTSLPPLKMPSLREGLRPALERESALDATTQVRTILSYHPGELFAADFVVTLCAQARTILSALQRSFAIPDSCRARWI